jgi:NAD(P)H-hydrate epimerase
VLALTTTQMIEVDRLMVEEYGISLMRMMENAGRHLAEMARRLLGGTVYDRQVVVLCGKGNNGGGGMVAARHLHNWGAVVTILLAGQAEALKEGPAHQWRTLQKIGVTITTGDDLTQADLLIDALIGYGLNGSPRGDSAKLIRWANAAGRPILSLDAPSGLDTNSGRPGKPCIRASTTLTLALPKSGFLAPEAGPFLGELYLADIAVPPELYRVLNLEVGFLFAENSIIKVPIDKTTV